MAAKTIDVNSFNAGMETAARVVEENAYTYGEKTTAELAECIRQAKRTDPSGSEER